MTVDVCIAQEVGYNLFGLKQSLKTDGLWAFLNDTDVSAE
jgi:hypothetical protein